MTTPAQLSNASTKRSDTLSLGICNGCQLMVELNLINPEHPKRARMEHNDSHKFESQFLGVTVPENNSVMFDPLSGMKTQYMGGSWRRKICLADAA